MKRFAVMADYHCNNACIFCSNQNSWRFKELPTKELKKQIEAFAKNDGDWLKISGGEPLISRHFFELLAIAKKNKIKKVAVFTNGRMLYYEDMIKKIKEVGPVGTEFSVSFHFPNDELYKKYSRADGFYQTMGGIKNLVKYNCNFIINTVIMKQNLPYLKVMLKNLKEAGVKKIQYKFIDGKELGNDYKKFVPQYSECAPIIKEILDDNRDIQITINEIPLCVVGKQYERQAVSCIDREGAMLTNSCKIVHLGKLLSPLFALPNCHGCVYKSICGGVRKEYVQTYGPGEFKPVVR